MSGIDILSDSTFAQKLDRQNALLSVLVRNNLPSTVDWNILKEVAHEGEFSDLYSIGDQFVDTWTDTVANRDYAYPWQFNHEGTVTLADGETLEKRPFLQCHYAHPFGVQFSHQRAFLRCPSGLSAGTYYFTIESSWGSNVTAGDIVCFTLTQPVPAGGRISGCYGAPDQAKSNWRVYSHSADGKTVIETVTPTFSASGVNLGVQKYATRNGDLNSLQEMAYGWNRWKTSALRQYLNSDAGVGNWWTAQDEWDIAPDQLTQKAGFLSGCSESFKEAIKTVAVKTYVNTVNDGGAEDYDITYDKVFIPSLEQIFVNPQKAGEGEYHKYWKRKSGSATPLAQYSTTPSMITYAVENHASAQSVRLRSASRGNAFNAWYVYASGYVYSSSANYALRFSPLVVL